MDGRVETIVFIHSGGKDPLTHAPSIATRLRLAAGGEVLQAHGLLGAAYNPANVLLLSGEETRKSGKGGQGSGMASWLRKEPYLMGYGNIPDDMMKVCDVSMGEAFSFIRQNFPAAKTIYFVMDDAFMSVYLHRLKMADEGLFRIVKPVYVPALSNPEYAAAYSPAYVAAYNALLWLRVAVKQVGLWQLGLFGIDRVFHRPLDMDLKKGVLAWVRNRLRPDLRPDLRA